MTGVARAQGSDAWFEALSGIGIMTYFFRNLLEVLIFVSAAILLVVASAVLW